MVADNDWSMLKKESGKLLVIGTTEEADTIGGLSALEWMKNRKYAPDASQPEDS
jgi:hypothetical protein